MLEASLGYKVRLSQKILKKMRERGTGREVEREGDYREICRVMVWFFFLSTVNRNKIILYISSVAEEPADGTLGGSHDVEVELAILRIILQSREMLFNQGEKCIFVCVRNTFLHMDSSVL